MSEYTENKHAEEASPVPEGAADGYTPEIPTVEPELKPEPDETELASPADTEDEA